MTDKLDWTAPLMLDDGKGTGVEVDSIECIVPGYGHAWFNVDGTHLYGELPCIINRPKPDAEPVEQLPADEPDTVTVPRMPEAEWRDKFQEQYYRLDFLLSELGLIRPDTPLDRFTASHPNWRDLDKEEAVRLALEGRDAS